jgi:DNA segregation ATPase FtsK/SpoIIIE, S-DNA-T family
MLTEIGYIGLVGSILYGTAPYVWDGIKKSTQNSKLRKAFMNGELYLKRKDEKIKVKPNIIKTKITDNKMTFVFSIPKGVNPEKFIERSYVFKQHFNDHISLSVENKRGILNVYQKGLPSTLPYNIDNFPIDERIPILCGQNLEGIMYIFDLVEFPHILVAGETGSGKSSAIRSILTTLIQAKSPNEVRLVLGDLKRSEFHLFKHLEHVDGVYHSANELRPALKKIKREMTKRGNLLDKYEVMNIDELKEKIPYIVICIDEVRLLKKETDVMDILEEISSIGRSLGIFIILSMQRPDSKLLEGALKVNCTVRMGFQTADKTNSKIIGTPGAEKLNVPGRMILKVNSTLQEIQSPWLTNIKAKQLLAPFKVQQSIEDKPEEHNEYDKVVELFKHEEKR